MGRDVWRHRCQKDANRGNSRNNIVVMKQEDKDLLLRDLCARLPYGVQCNYSGEIPLLGEVANNVGELRGISVGDIYPFKIHGKWWGFGDIKPYLRPMSSMTEEERNEYENFITNEKDDQLRFCNELVFYNRHHFDYRGLIPMGLGIDCTGLNVYENEKSM